MEQSTCALHECTSKPDDGNLWCAEHTVEAKAPRKPCPECGAPCSIPAKTCMICRSAMRFYGTYKPEYRRCKICNKTLTGANRARGVYCSRKCVYADPEVCEKLGPERKQVTKTCVGCKRDFTVKAANAHRYNYCTRECSSFHRGRDGTCERCGKAFRYGSTRTRRHCSEECRRPPHYVECIECGKVFRDTPSGAETRRFCDNRCYRRYKGETSIEAAVREVIESTGMLYSQEESVGGWVVDFLALPNIIIEADGDYWHRFRPDVDARKTAELEALGYVVIRIWESDIRSGAFRKPLLRALKKGAMV